jgi:integrase/recombinase XerC
VKKVARLAGVQMSAHTVRHSCLSFLIRSGTDVVTVAEIAGHSRLETTRRYSLPTAAVKAQAMERLIHDSA